MVVKYRPILKGFLPQLTPVVVKRRPILKGFLPQLIPVLLSNMAYDENEEDVINAEAAESHGDCPDRDQDIKPFIMQKVRPDARVEEKCL